MLTTSAAIVAARATLRNCRRDVKSVLPSLKLAEPVAHSDTSRSCAKGDQANEVKVRREDRQQKLRSQKSPKQSRLRLKPSLAALPDPAPDSYLTAICPRSRQASKADVSLTRSSPMASGHTPGWKTTAEFASTSRSATAWPRAKASGSRSQPDQ